MPNVDLGAVIAQLLGPFGLTAFLILTVVGFVRQWIVPGKAWQEALVGWTSATAALNRMAEAIERRNSLDEMALDRRSRDGAG